LEGLAGLTGGDQARNQSVKIEQPEGVSATSRQFAIFSTTGN